MTIPSYPPGQYPPRPPRKRWIWLWVLFGVIVLVFGGCFALTGTAGKQTDRAETQSTIPVPTQISQPASTVATRGTINTTTIAPLTAKPPTGSGNSIVYEIVSDADLLSVTYFDEKSAMHQELNVSAPWAKTIANNSTVAFAGLGAQTSGTSVTCRITVDGKVKDTETDTGQYASVSCNASLF